MFPLFLGHLERKSSIGPNELNIRTSQTEIRNVCLSEILIFSLLSLSVTHLQSTAAYVEA